MHGNYGRKHTAEAREKMRAVHARRRETGAYKRQHSEESRAKMSDAHRRHAIYKRTGMYPEKEPDNVVTRVQSEEQEGL